MAEHPPWPRPGALSGPPTSVTPKPGSARHSHRPLEWNPTPSVRRTPPSKALGPREPTEGCRNFCPEGRVMAESPGSWSVSLSLHLRVQPAPRLGRGALPLPHLSPHPPHAGRLRRFRRQRGPAGLRPHTLQGRPPPPTGARACPGRAEPKVKVWTPRRSSEALWARREPSPSPQTCSPRLAGCQPSVPAGSAAGLGPHCPSWKGQGQSPGGWGQR